MKLIVYICFEGLSGSCTLKTCWKAAPEFRIVSKVLKHMFRNAILVNQSNMGNGDPFSTNRLAKQRNKNNIRSPRKIFNKHATPFNQNALENSLFYYQRSPTFCDRDPISDIHGTSGRKVKIHEFYTNKKKQLKNNVRLIFKV